MSNFTADLALNEPKKHSVRYDSTEANPPISSLYISKLAFPSGKWPKKVTVTVEWED